jgi:hypothetical protein
VAIASDGPVPDTHLAQLDLADVAAIANFAVQNATLR